MPTSRPILSLFALAAVLAGCGAPSGSDANPSSSTLTRSQSTHETPVAFRDVDGQLKCPVMGSQIASEKEASGFSDHDGVRYYFCCGACKPKFDTDPHRYVKH